MRFIIFFIRIFSSSLSGQNFVCKYILLVLRVTIIVEYMYEMVWYWIAKILHIRVRMRFYKVEEKNSVFNSIWFNSSHFTANLLEFMLIHIVNEHKHEMMKPSPINKKNMKLCFVRKHSSHGTIMVLPWQTVHALASQSHNITLMFSSSMYLYIIIQILDTPNATAAILLALSFQFCKVFQWLFIFVDQRPLKHQDANRSK